MKKIFIVLIIIGLFASCTKYTVTQKSYDVEDFCNLVKLVEDTGDTIYVDKNTDVLYIYQYSGISPIMKADGTCLTLTEKIKD